MFSNQTAKNGDRAAIALMIAAFVLAGVVILVLLQPMTQVFDGCTTAAASLALLAGLAVRALRALNPTRNGEGRWGSRLLVGIWMGVVAGAFIGIVPGPVSVDEAMISAVVGFSSGISPYLLMTMSDASFRHGSRRRDEGTKPPLLRSVPNWTVHDRFE